MKLSHTFLGVVAVASIAASAHAQAKPNFAGTWAVVADPNAPPAGGRGGFGGLGQSATIAQDDKTITVTPTSQMGEIKSVYNLDGTDSKNTLTMGGNSFDRMSKVKWDGAKMVVTTTSSFNGNTFETTQAWWMDGANLVVETTAPGRGGGAPTTTKMTYKKP